MTRKILVALVPMAVAGTAIAQPSEILASQDYMSSGFFTSDFLRGEEANSGRASHRATSPTIFGVTGETAYFAFDFDPMAFAGPVSEAVFRVETVAPGFFAEPSPESPADISIHSLTADPLASVDQSLAGGAGSWLDFRDSQITTSSVVSTTSLDGLGVFDWDITSLVNEWIANGDSNFAYTIGTGALLDEDGGAAAAFVNSSYIGLTGDEVTARIVIIPAPGALALLGMGGVACVRRRR
ncbi:MAG: hypothetical protein AAGG07_01100 [Planctomycetota bacterium]